MKEINFYTIPIAKLEGPDRGVPDGRYLSVKLKTILVDFITTYSSPSFYSNDRPCLFEGCSGFSTYSSLPRIELKHDATWDDFGRAYYSSCSYQFTGFHFALYSVDELRQQIEAKMRQYEQNRIVSGSCLIARGCCSSPLERYFAENLWDEDLCAWVEDFKARAVFVRNLRVTDDHSCRPFYNTSIYLHQLAKLSLSVQNAQTSAALRPCCRSFLMASCRQLSGDDLLGH